MVVIPLPSGTILQTLLGDQVQRWDMQPDGSFVKTEPDPALSPDDPRMLGTHQSLMNLAMDSVSTAAVTSQD